MLQLPKIIKKTLSVRIGLMVVLAMTLLLMASMLVMLHYSRKAVKTEAIEKAVRSLEGMTNNIDNILLSVEQTTGNIYFNMMPYLNNPDMMSVFAKEAAQAMIAGERRVHRATRGSDRHQYGQWSMVNGQWSMVNLQRITSTDSVLVKGIRVLL